MIVTGAGRRIAIGAAIARRAVADGACVLLHSWAPHDAEQPWGADPGGPEALVEELRQAGGRVAHVSENKFGFRCLVQQRSGGQVVEYANLVAPST